jgi:hypothetical protein
MTNSYDPRLEAELSTDIENQNALTSEQAEKQRQTALEYEAQRKAFDQQSQIDAENRAAVDAQAKAEMQDPRNKEKWGVGEYIKEASSAVGGGVQDTVSSVITAPERVIDYFTGEMERESKEGGYKPEWDDWFVKDDKPIETKTWWGGMIRGLTHFGTLAAIPIPGTAGLKALTASSKAARAAMASTKVTKVAQSARAARVAAHKIKVLPSFKVLGTKVPALTGRNIVKGAALGAKADALSVYSQQENALQILRDRYGWHDTWITTNDTDHPLTKTLKNIVEGMGIGVVADGVLHAFMGGARGTAKAILTSTDGTKKIVKEADVINARQESVDSQVIEQGKTQKKEPGFRGAKNKPIADSTQGNATSLEQPYEVRQQKKRIQEEYGAEDGSTGSLVTNVALDNMGKSSKLAREELKKIARTFMSDARIEADIAEAKAKRQPLEQYWADTVVVAKEIYEGRNTSELTPAQFWKQLHEVEVKRSNKKTGESITFIDPKMTAAADMVIGSLFREIRDMGVLGREVGDIYDLGDIDGPAQHLFEKIVAGLRLTKRSRMESSQLLREFGAGKVSKKATTKSIDDAVDQQVNESIEAFRLAMKLAGESDNDDLFKAIFEAISMSKTIQNVEDFDAFMRTKMRGGELDGSKQTGQLIKELEGVMINSVLSGPKTPVRAIMGTSSATFLRPLTMAVGSGLRGDGQGLRASLASVNAMREAIPESFSLFRERLNAYWAGDINTIKSRFSERTKGDTQWEMYGHWAETRGSKADKGIYRMANLARAANDNRFLTYSTKIMAATDDAFGYIIGRARLREKAMFKAMGEANKGDFTKIDPQLLREYEDAFTDSVFDSEGNLVDSAAVYAKKEATLTQDLTGFAKGLNDVFEKHPFAKPFFLFARTGVNGLALTAKHTPGFNFLVKEWNDIAFAQVGGDITGLTKYGISTDRDLINAKAIQAGRLALGSSVIFMAGQKFLGGELSGNGPADRQKRQRWLDDGYLPRSIKLGDTWVSYDAFEPFNQVLTLVGDIGDHMELMGEEWAEDNLLKLSLTIAQGITSKSYLAGLQQFVDLFSGQPGQHNRIIASLANNSLPLSSLRNEIGKVLTPYTRELGSDIWSSLRNRNLTSEYIASEQIPIKYDMLTGKPIKDHDFVTRMFNAVSPVQFNLDYSPGRQMLFDSGYDLRQSTYTGPDGTNLSNSPRVRSLFQKAIGDQNLLLRLDKMAVDPGIQESISLMNYKRNNGERDLDPKDFQHNKILSKLFNDAKIKAWASIQNDPEVQKLLAEETDRKVRGINAQRQSLESIINLDSK